MNIISEPADLLCKGNVGALYVGSLRATTEEYLMSHDISVVISLVPTAITLTLALTHPAFTIIHHYFKIDDDPDQAPIMRGYLKEVLPLIHKYRLNHHNVLVHCRMGVQRAPTVCAHYLHRYYGYNIERCYRKVIDRRPCAFYWGKYYTFEALTLSIKN